MKRLKIHKGDQVMVVSGKEAGKSGKVMRVEAAEGRVVVEHLNMLKKHTKPHPKKNPQGGVIEHEGPIDISNVMLMCPACNQPTRVGYRFTDGGAKIRVCRRPGCGSDIDKA
jgi:large subunit ribosomal protein L24